MHGPCDCEDIASLLLLFSWREPSKSWGTHVFWQRGVCLWPRFYMLTYYWNGSVSKQPRALQPLHVGGSDRDGLDKKLTHILAPPNSSFLCPPPPKKKHCTKTIPCCTLFFFDSGTDEHPAMGHSWHSVCISLMWSPAHGRTPELCSGPAHSLDAGPWNLGEREARGGLHTVTAASLS